MGPARRAQIVEAAVAVIAEQGIQNLSLSAIEKKAGMARGHLTYYFPAKEKILLAVFDHLLELIYERIGTPRGEGRLPEVESGAEWVRQLLELVLLRPPVSPEFPCLQHTFLSQIGHREDFRKRLASLYEEWRGNMAGGLERDRAGSPQTPAADPRLLASLVQAILHGLSVQLQADPNAFDREAMLRLCLDVLGGHLRPAEPTAPPRGNHATGPRPRARRAQ
ncbi:MAG TPA: TetR/AcrR family transcriptional regulator [Gemmataceae bacterium]|nr:TetR/AcrR family transcriptional regulator [Gemmataceae bacterium]